MASKAFLQALEQLLAATAEHTSLLTEEVDQSDDSLHSEQLMRAGASMNYYRRKVIRMASKGGADGR